MKLIKMNKKTKFIITIALILLSVSLVFYLSIKTEIWQKSVESESEALKPYSLYISSGRYYLQSKDYEKAKESFDKAIGIDPNQSPGWSGLGYALIGSGNLEKAEECLNKALTLNPNDALAYGGLGQISLYKKGDIEKAKEYYLKVLKLEPNEWTYIALGRISLQEGDLKEAQKYFDQASELDPDNVQAYIARGRALLEEGKQEEAEECFKKALEK